MRQTGREFLDLNIDTSIADPEKIVLLRLEHRYRTDDARNGRLDTPRTEHGKVNTLCNAYMSGQTDSLTAPSEPLSE